MIYWQKSRHDKNHKQIQKLMKLYMINKTWWIQKWSWDCKRGKMGYKNFHLHKNATYVDQCACSKYDAYDPLLFSWFYEKGLVNKDWIFFHIYISRLFHSFWFWAESIVRWGENRRSPRKTTWPPATRTWLVSYVTRAKLEPIAVRWQVIESAKD